MNTALLSSEAVELLSRITGKKLSTKDITPPVIFLAALITVLLGVMFVDGVVTDEEKQRWQKSINKFIVSQDIRQLSQSLSKGVRENQIYKNINYLLTLTSGFSHSAKLLLMAFGHEMAVADGKIDLRELNYLELIANHLNVDPQHLAVLKTVFSQQGTIEPKALCEVRYLLNPARFHTLDIVFVKAADEMLAVLPATSQVKLTQLHNITTYKQLGDFTRNRQQIGNICNQVIQIIQDCVNHDFVSDTLTNEIQNVSKKIQSQRFRLAVVGEFSQGKSTLLNALLGEEIQPVRAIPCSGTISVLKYGSQKRVVCRYKDGQEEDIPFENYQEKAAISEEAAFSNLSDELLKSEIAEIVFEHPDLDLCRSGVEIVDSPGLNEHPERTAITQQLLKGTDAVIFLVNASRPLTQGERELIQDLKAQINGRQVDKPAENLFIVVNFMDLLRREKDRQDVKQRIERFVYGENIITGESRLHFISAQAALDAILERNEDEYLKIFRNFTDSIQKFLTDERGYIKIKGYVNELNCLIQACLDGLTQTENILDSNVKISEAEKQKILEQISEATGRDIKIRILADRLFDQVIEQTIESWNEWLEGLDERLLAKVEKWSSKHSAVFSRDKLVNDYTRQFNQDLSAELDTWLENQLKQKILNQNLEILDEQIKEEITAIKSDLYEINKIIENQTNTNWVFYRSNESIEVGILGNLGIAGLGAAVLLPTVVFAGPILFIIGSLIAGGLLGTGVGGVLDIDGEIRVKVFENGCQQFVESLEVVFEKINSIIDTAFYDRVEQSEEIIANAISFYDNLLEQQEKTHEKDIEQRQKEKDIIFQKRQELEQVQKNIEEILTQYTG